MLPFQIQQRKIKNEAIEIGLISRFLWLTFQKPVESKNESRSLKGDVNISSCTNVDSRHISNFLSQIPTPLLPHGKDLSVMPLHFLRIYFTWGATKTGTMGWPIPYHCKLVEIGNSKVYYTKKVFTYELHSQWYLS